MINLINTTWHYGERLHGRDFAKWAFVRFPVDGWKWNHFVLLIYLWVMLEHSSCVPHRLASYIAWLWHQQQDACVIKQNHSIESQNWHQTDDKHDFGLSQTTQWRIHNNDTLDSIVFICPEKRPLSFLSAAQPPSNNHHKNDRRRTKHLHTQTHECDVQMKRIYAPKKLTSISICIDFNYVWSNLIKTYSVSIARRVDGESMRIDQIAHSVVIGLHWVCLCLE